MVEVFFYVGTGILAVRSSASFVTAIARVIGLLYCTFFHFDSLKGGLINALVSKPCHVSSRRIRRESIINAHEIKNYM
jgi:hypothetical protein